MTEPWQMCDPEVDEHTYGSGPRCECGATKAPFEPPDIPAMHGMFQMVLAVYDHERGWLTTKRSVIYGGRHGRAPMIDLPEDEIEKILSHELRGGIRACKHAWEKP